MNTVSLNKTRSLTAVRVATLLALAALAIAFFAFPFASYAMGCKGKNKSKPVTAGTIQFLDLMQDNPETVSAPTNSGKIVTPVIPTETMTLITPDKVTSMTVWNWVKASFNGKEVYGTIADTRGDVWLTNGAFVKLTDLPDGIKIQLAPKNAQP